MFNIIKAIERKNDTVHIRPDIMPDIIPNNVSNMLLEIEQGTAAIDYLFNSLDMIPYLSEFRGRDINDLIDQIQKDYSYKVKTSKVLFDMIDKNIFIQYIIIIYKIDMKDTIIDNYGVY